MDTPSTDPTEEVTQWLQEVGRRRWRASDRRDKAFEEPTELAPGRETPIDKPAGLWRALLLALLGVVSIHYLYMTPNLEILSLPALQVFVFSG